MANWAFNGDNKGIICMPRVGVNLIRSNLFKDVCTCLEQFKDEGNRQTLDLHVMC